MTTSREAVSGAAPAAGQTGTAGKPKRAYATPQVVSLGSVAELTQKSGSVGDNGLKKKGM
jgi:hypothetical protein